MHRLKVDARVAGEFNRALVFDLLRSRAEVSRMSLVRETGLSKATMSQIIDQFIQEGFVETVGPGTSTLGRRPTLLRFNPAARFAIGVELGDTTCSVVLTDLNTKPLRTVSGMTSGAEASDVLEAVVVLVGELLAEMPPEKLVGIGVGTPGLVDSRRGVIQLAPDLGWCDVSVGPLLAERFGVPVAVINRAKAAAVGEAWSGAGEDVDNLVYVSVSSGIAAGIVINQRLYRGVSMSEGELGHTTVIPGPDAPLCACGNRGCLQTVAAGPALLARARERLRAGRGPVPSLLANGQLEAMTLESVATLAEEGHSAILDVLDDTAEFLGIAGANLVDLFNPAMLVLGGGVIRAIPSLVPRIEAVIRRRAVSVPAEAVDIVASQLGRQAVPIGAAAFLFSQVSVVASPPVHTSTPRLPRADVVHPPSRVIRS